MPRKNSTDKQLPKKAGRPERAAKRTARTTTRKWKNAPLLGKPTNPTIRLGQNQPGREMVNHPTHYGGSGRMR